MKGNLKVSTFALLQLDALEEGLEVAGAEAGMVAALNDLDEGGWTDIRAVAQKANCTVTRLVCLAHALAEDLHLKTCVFLVPGMRLRGLCQAAISSHCSERWWRAAIIKQKKAL